MNKGKTPRMSRAAAPEIRDWQCVAVMMVLAAVFFSDIIFGNAYLWEDFLYQYYPWRNFAATTIAEGHLPLWNPFIFNGMPFLADMQTAVFYIPSLFLTLFVGDGRLSSYWVELLVISHFILAGVTMYFLAKSYGVRPVPALFAGICYMFSSYMVLHAIHLTIVTTAALFPLVLQLFRKALHSNDLLWVFITPLLLAQTVLAGHPQLFVYLYFFLLIFFLFELLSDRGGAPLVSKPTAVMIGRAVFIVGCSVALSMVQLLPTLELSELSQRAEITYEKSTEGSLTWVNLLSFIFPKLFGVSEPGNYSYWGPGTYWYYWEDCLYRGALPVILAVGTLADRRRNKHVLFWFGVSVFTILFSLGGDFFFHRLFHDFVPGFSKFRTPARMTVFMGIGLSLLSAFALQALFYENRSRDEIRRWRNVVLSLLGLAVALWLLIASSFLSGILPFLANPRILPLVRSEVSLSLVLFAISGILVMAALSPRVPRTASAYLLTGMLFLDLFLFGGGHNNATVNPEQYFLRAAPLIRHLKQQASTELFRVNTRNPDGMLMDRNQGMIDRIQLTEGYTPLALQRFYPVGTSTDKAFDLLNVKYKTITDTARRTLSLAEHPTYFPRAFFRYAFHICRNEEDLLAFLKSSEFDHRRIAILEKDPGISPTAPGQEPLGKVSITSYGSNEIRLAAETSHDGLLVVSEIHYPGWKAYVDGRAAEIFRTNYCLRGVAVGSGVHVVELRFEPPSFFLGARLSLAALLVCGTGLGIRALRRRRSVAESR